MKRAAIALLLFTFRPGIGAAQQPCRPDAQGIDALVHEVTAIRLAALESGANLDGALLAVGADGECRATWLSWQRTTTESFRIAVSAAQPGPRTPGRTILYVNGVRTTPAAHCETLREIAAVSGATVVGVFNATNGTLHDISEAGRQRLLGFDPSAFPPNRASRFDEHYSNKLTGESAVQAVSWILTDLALDGSPVPEVWAHSQGGATVSLALTQAELRLRTQAPRRSLKGVRVVTFASAAVEWPSGPTYEHYIHTLDLVPRVLGLGILRGSSHGSRVVHFSGGAGEFGAWRYGLPSFTKNHSVSMYLARWRREHRGGASGQW